MGGWGEYIAAWGFFLASHAVPVRPPVKSWLVSRLGQAGFSSGYSLLSLAALGWLILAARRAPLVVLWSEPPGAAHLLLAVMCLALSVLTLGLFRPNPLSFGGNGRPFDPDRPGPLRLIRHPVLLALLLWSLGHLVVNGDLAHVLLFGGFAGFAWLGMRMIDRRNSRRLGADLPALTARIGRAPLSIGPRAGARLLAAAVAVAALLALHPWITGIPILQRYLP